MNKIDINKIFFNPKRNRFGGFLRVSEYSMPTDYDKRKGKSKDKSDRFYSTTIFTKSIGEEKNSYDMEAISNHELRYTPEQVEEYVKEEIRKRQEDLDCWIKYGNKKIEEAKELMTEEFKYLKRSTDYLDYKE